MTAAGTIVQERTSQTSRSPDIDTGQWFCAMPAPQGPTAPQPARSLGEWAAIFGSRDPNTGSWDAVDSFFKAGGSRCWFSRVVSSTAVAASLALKDAGNADCLRITASGPGTWGNGLSPQVIAGVAGSTYRVRILQGATVLVETPDLSVPDDAVAYFADNPRYATASAITANPPKVAAATPLTGGTEGGALVDADYVTAIARFGKALGPGQVSAPGNRAAAVQQALRDHGMQWGSPALRIAYLDGADAFSTATVLGSVSGLAGSNAKAAAAFAPRIVAAGLTASGGRRTLWPSPIVAGLTAKSDGAGRGYAAAAAGDGGVIDFALNLTQDWSSATDQDALYNATTGAVNPILILPGGIKVYGWHTLANPSTQETYLGLGEVRTLMAFRALAEAAGEPFVHRKITAATISAWHTKLLGICTALYNQGDLFSEQENRPDEAFYVNTDEPVNTSATAAARQLLAEVGLRVSRTADYVIVNVVKVPLTEAIAA